MLRPLARHEGLWRYTEGQRRGLGIAHSEPLYVLRKQGEDNTLVVGGRARLGMHGCLTGPVNLLCPPEQWPDTLLARLRHRQRPTPARVELTDDGLRVTQLLEYTRVVCRRAQPLTHLVPPDEQALQREEVSRGAKAFLGTAVDKNRLHSNPSSCARS